MNNPFNHRLIRASLSVLLASTICLCPMTMVATIRTVTNLNDSGSGSLRNAMLASSAGDTINFSITGTISAPYGPMLIDKDLTIEEGDLTPRMKLRRKAVTEKHQAELDAMYADA